MTKSIYLGYDIPAYHERLRRAIARYGLPAGAPRAWLRDPDFQAWDYLGYMQPSGAMYWQCYLYPALQAAGIDQRADLSTITILDKRWHFGERHWDFSPGKVKHRVQQALKGLNYLVMIEFEVFRNVRYLQSLPRNKVKLFRAQGRLIAPHVQGLVWGKLPSPRQRSLFEGGIFNAPGIKVIDVHHFPGALRYMGKPPYRGRSVFRLSSGRLARRPWPEMSLTLHHLLLRNLHQFSCPDLMFSGGEGRGILADAKRLWRDYKPGSTHPTDYRPPLASGLVKRAQR
jgi:hypothetical protein